MFQGKQALSTESCDLNSAALFLADLGWSITLKIPCSFAECRNSSFTWNQSPSLPQIIGSLNPVDLMQLFYLKHKSFTVWGIQNWLKRKTTQPCVIGSILCNFWEQVMHCLWWCSRHIHPLLYHKWLSSLRGYREGKKEKAGRFNDF